MTRPPVLAISGKKNSGKTTLTEKIVAELTALGLKTAVVKHVRHGFIPDQPGTDSWRFRQAGALGVAAYDDQTFLLVKEQQVEADYLLEQFPEVDLLLVEGGKASAWPKLELILAGGPVCDPATVVAYVSDLPVDSGGIPVLSFQDLPAILQTVLAFIKSNL